MPTLDEHGPGSEHSRSLLATLVVAVAACLMMMVFPLWLFGGMGLDSPDSGFRRLAFHVIVSAPLILLGAIFAAWPRKRGNNKVLLALAAGAVATVAAALFFG